MKNIIYKIFSGNPDEEVHNEFIKFSRGVFDNRYLIEGKRQKDKWSIKTSSEFANFLVRRLLEKVEGEIEAKGAIISTLDLSKDVDFEIADTKGYMGIKQLLIDTKTSAGKIIALMDKYPRAFYALTFSIGGNELKIKAKAPKSGKPGTKGDDEGPKADFCSIKTNDKEIINDLFFDFPSFYEIKVKHIIEVREIEIPKGIKDPREMREKAVRKGILKRFVQVDGVKKQSEKAFSA